MRLTELSPRWIRRAGEAVGIVFRCPSCQAKEGGCAGRGRVWLAITFTGMSSSRFPFA